MVFPLLSKQSLENIFQSIKITYRVSQNLIAVIKPNQHDSPEQKSMEEHDCLGKVALEATPEHSVSVPMLQVLTPDAPKEGEAQRYQKRAFLMVLGLKLTVRGLDLRSVSQGCCQKSLQQGSSHPKDNQHQRPWLKFPKYCHAMSCCPQPQRGKAANTHLETAPAAEAKCASISLKFKSLRPRNEPIVCFCASFSADGESCFPSHGKSQ